MSSFVEGTKKGTTGLYSDGIKYQFEYMHAEML